ncbi:hypothetical protein Cgig2_024958 [Carnegiea gigantea]|uniref:Uncharacterized protein n=1 Tax=Carnegiea gigantea TaxID=171969 RepID=A0A9Q1GNL0_9CARY|nr:hypothetical protein Cgig2_024958 [Carnegiea gigantea]
MGSCASIHKNSASALELHMSSTVAAQEDHAISKPDSIPSTPIKDHMDKPSHPNPTPTPAIVDPRILSLRNRSQASRLSSGSIASYRSYGIILNSLCFVSWCFADDFDCFSGVFLFFDFWVFLGSKEETFYDTQAWLESDCDDDFYSVDGDFSSRGSTPAHSAVGTPRLNRVFSPQVNRALLEGRPPLRSGSNLSRGSTPAHHHNSSSPQITGTFSEVVPSSNPDSTSTTKKKKRLADLFRESIRERAGEFLALGALEDQGQDNQADPKKEASSNSPASVLPPKSGKRTPHVSGPLSQTSSGKITPADEYFPDKDNPVKSAQCCFPRLVSIRSYRENRKASNPPTPSNDLTA